MSSGLVAQWRRAEAIRQARQRRFRRQKRAAFQRMILWMHRSQTSPYFRLQATPRVLPPYLQQFSAITGPTQVPGDRWKHPSEKQIKQAKQNQRGSIMIQLLAQDVDAQYHCFQPYLLLDDIIHLHRSCRLWSHWIRSPVSAVHHGHLRNNGCLITCRNSSDLFRVTHSLWIKGYLYGCRIMPLVGQQSQSCWLTDSFFRVRLNGPAIPLLAQLTEFTHIQHLTLDHVHPNEMTSERIQAYFIVIAPTLRSLELFPTTNSDLSLRRLYAHPWNLDDGGHVNVVLEQLYLLVNLEELRIFARRHIDWSHLDQLSTLPQFHTFEFKNEETGFEVHEKFASVLARCIHLKHCSFACHIGAPVTGIFEFLSFRHQVRQSLLDQDSCEPDPLEYLDLSTSIIDSKLLKSLVQYAPNLTSLNGYYWSLSRDWSLLSTFKQLKSLDLTMTVHSDRLAVHQFLNGLCHCRTIDSLTLGSISGTILEVHLRSILSHLPRLTHLTLTKLTLENVVGFDEPNQLRRLVLNECRGQRTHGVVKDVLFIRATLPTIPTLVHLTLLEPSPAGDASWFASEAVNWSLVSMTRLLFQRQPRLVTGEFIEKFYKRLELETRIDRTH